MRLANIAAISLVTLLISSTAFGQDHAEPDPQAWVPAVFFATSGAGILVGTLAGIATLDRSDELEMRCPASCTEEEIDNAREIADASTAAFALAGIAAAVGTVTLLMHIYATGEEEDTRVGVTVDASGVAVQLEF